MNNINETNIKSPDHFNHSSEVAAAVRPIEVHSTSGPENSAGGPPPIILPSGASRPIMLMVILMTSFITTFTGSALNLSVPAISSEFHAGAVSVGWIVTGYILASAALSVPFGRVADLYGKRPVFITGEVIFTMAALLCTLAQSTLMIISFRLIQGIGSAMIFATNIASLTAIYPPEKRGAMLGLSTSVTYLGLSLGPVLGGVLNQHFGWRSIFIVTTVYSLITTVIALRSFRPPLPAKVNGKVLHSIDLPGCLFFTLAVAMAMYGFSTITTSIASKFILACGAILTVVFILRELKTDSPAMNMKLFTSDRSFGLANLAALLNYSASYAVSYLLSIYLQSVQFYSSQTAGLILITCPVFQTILSPLAGKLSDRIAPYRLATFGMAITGAGIFMLVFTDTDMTLFYVLTSLSIIGIGFAFFSSPNTNAVMSAVDKRDLSIASSILATSRNLGHGTSMAIVSCVVAATVGNVTLSDAPAASIVTAMKIIFAINTLLCIAGTLSSAVRRKQN